MKYNRRLITVIITGVLVSTSTAFFLRASKNNEADTDLESQEGLRALKEMLASEVRMLFTVVRYGIFDCRACSTSTK